MEWQILFPGENKIFQNVICSKILPAVPFKGSDFWIMPNDFFFPPFCKGRQLLQMAKLSPRVWNLSKTGWEKDRMIGGTLSNKQILLFKRAPMKRVTIIPYQNYFPWRFSLCISVLPELLFKILKKTNCLPLVQKYTLFAFVHLLTSDGWGCHWFPIIFSLVSHFLHFCLLLCSTISATQEMEYSSIHLYISR